MAPAGRWSRSVPRRALHHGARDAPGEALLAVLENDVREILFVHLIQQVRRSGALGLVHTHVQRLISSETEAAAFGVELHGRDPEVGQSAGHPRDAAGVEHTPQLAVVGMHEFPPVAPRGQRISREAQRVAVAIETDAVRRLPQAAPAAVAANAHRAVTNRPPRPGSKQRPALSASITGS